MRSVMIFLSLILLSLTVHTAARAASVTPSGLHVAGHQLKNAAGQAVQLQGVMLSQLEYSCADNDGEYRASSYPALRTWHVNTVKIPINPNYWDGQGCNAASYRTQVYSAVDTALGQGMYVLLSLLAFEPGQGDKTSGQTSLDTWAQVGAHYAGDQRVLYETFSEMHDISDATWQANTQALINVLNAAAPASIVLANSDSWGGTIGNLWSAGYHVTGHNLGFTIHLYDNGGNANAANWPASFANLAQQYPIVAGEFGSNTGSCGQAFLRQLMPYMAQHIAGWIAWEWNPDSANYCSRPALLVDRNASLASGQPSSYGQVIHDWYTSNGLGLGTTTPPAETPPPPAQTPQQGAAGISITIPPGATLGGLAHEYGTSVPALAQCNGITNPNLIYAGARLTICGPAAPPATHHAPASYHNSGVPGECVWYVQDQRQDLDMAGWGNALSLTTSAARHGIATGTVPRVDAIVVYQPGVQGASAYGHAAIVEQVFSNGTFIVHEMAYYGLTALDGGASGAWRVDARLSWTQPGVSFIYRP